MDNGNMVYDYAFSIIAIFVLFIACINFMNLSTARSASRAKEVGTRKALGAHRSKLAHQFFCETFLLSFVSFVISSGLVEIALPFFRFLTGSELSFDYIIMPRLILGYLGLVSFVAFVAGSYPAFFLSAYQPIKVLTGKLKTGVTGIRIRSILVTFQFTISIGLIIGSVISFSQLSYMKQKRLGLKKEQIVVIRIVDDSLRKMIPTIKAELTSISGIVDVAASSHVPGRVSDWRAFVPQGYNLSQTRMMGKISINPDFIPTMGIQIVDRRNFSHEIINDQSEPILINEAAARRYDWKNPVGKTVHLLMNDTNKTVIGVVRDYHLRSLHHEIMPLYIDNDPSNFLYISTKIIPEDVSKTLRDLRKKWAEIAPDQPFDYFFLDESFDRQYRAEEKLGLVFSNFTLLAILVASLGLFGLASFTAEQRTI
ncbi:MAG: FtsX-like permease family protein [Desulfobacterales bacterium]